MFEIVRTEPGDCNFTHFEHFPKEIYPGDSLALAVPESINGEYLEAGYLLKHNGKICSRAALYYNPHLRYQQKTTCTVGNFESVDDKEISSQLLTHLATRAKSLKAEYLIGPMNGSTWDNYRFSLHHDHPHFFLEPYHHLYYHEHFLHSGFDVIARYYSSIETNMQYNSAAVMQREAQLREDGIVFRDIDLDNYEAELEKVFEFNMTAFSANFLYTPISKTDFMKKYAQTKRFIEPRYVVMAEDAYGHLIGYFFCIHDHNNKEPKSLIAKTVARHPDKKWSGVGHVLGNIICGRAHRAGYQCIIHSFMYQDGTSKKMSKNFDGKEYKNYVLLGKAL
jgi:hypothetical protein